MRDIVYLDGKFVERANARVSVEDRGYQFADGIYEVVRFHGRNGLRLNEHLERLQRSAAHLRIKGMPSVDEWLAIVDKLVVNCEIPDDPSVVNCLYQQVTRGDNPRNHVFPKNPVAPVCVAYFRPAPAYPASYREEGINLSVQPDERWERCFIKSVCLLPVVLAKQAAVENDAFEAVLVRNGVVTEGGSTNVYCVIDGALHTHPQGPHILSGITREMVFEAAQAAGVAVVERPVPLDEFRAAQEAFISSTTLDIMPATRVDGKPVGDGLVGPVTRRLMDTLATMVTDEVSRKPVIA